MSSTHHPSPPLQPQPPPSDPHPYTATGAPSARTSFTRVDVGLMEEIGIATGVTAPPSADASTTPLNPQPTTTLDVDSPRLAPSSPTRDASTAPPETLDSAPQGTPTTAPVLTSTPDAAHESKSGSTDVPAPAPAPAPAPTPAPTAPSSTPAPEPLPVPQTPQTSLTFLLVSGRRRTMSFDPETTIGRVKELVWNAWPSEWQDECPPAPSYLRILYLGKILQDDDTLTKLSFPSHIPSPSPPAQNSTTTTPPPAPTIVHLSIRPYAPPPDDDALKKKARRGRRRGNTTTNSNNAGNGGTGGAVVVGGNEGGNAGGGGEDRGAGCCGCVVC